MQNAPSVLCELIELKLVLCLICMAIMKIQSKSIWNKIKSVPEFKYIPLSIEIEDELKALTTGFNSTKRNLYTHYRDGAKLNISERWRCANEMNHPKELMQMLRLVTLCKNQSILSFTYIINEFNRKQKKMKC